MTESRRDSTKKNLDQQFETGGSQSPRDRMGHKDKADQLANLHRNDPTKPTEEMVNQSRLIAARIEELSKRNNKRKYQEFASPERENDHLVKSDDQYSRAVLPPTMEEHQRNKEQAEKMGNHTRIPDVSAITQINMEMGYIQKLDGSWEAPSTSRQPVDQVSSPVSASSSEVERQKEETLKKMLEEVGLAQQSDGSLKTPDEVRQKEIKKKKHQIIQRQISLNELTALSTAGRKSKQEDLYKCCDKLIAFSNKSGDKYYEYIREDYKEDIRNHIDIAIETMDKLRNILTNRKWIQEGSIRAIVRNKLNKAYSDAGLE